MPIFAMFRFDTEDYVTPESNDALLAIAEALNAQGVRATFPMVGQKARFLHAEGRNDAIRALEPHALGFHTHRHSAHPTLPERVETLSWREALEALDESEHPGLEAVAEVFGRHPCAYTQAGGTWLPHSHALLPRWEIPFFYTETWNSYFDAVGTPYAYGGSPGLTSPVDVMRVFDLASTGREDEARKQVQAKLAELRAAGGGMLGFVAHPTELVTTGAFWDIVNFGAGQNLVPIEGPYNKPELKPREQVTADLEAFARFVADLAAEPDVQIVAIDEYQRLMPQVADAPLDDAAWGALAGCAASGRIPLFDGRRYYSPIDGLMLLGRLMLSAERNDSSGFTLSEARTAAGFTAGPVADPEPNSAPTSVSAPLAAWRQAWQSCIVYGRREGCLPATCIVSGKSVPIGALVGALGKIVESARINHGKLPLLEALRRLAASSPDKSFTAPVLQPSAHIVKPVERLHWDWPIFAPDARFERCYAFTQAQMWTYTPLPDPARSAV